MSDHKTTTCTPTWHETPAVPGRETDGWLTDLGNPRWRLLKPLPLFFDRLELPDGRELEEVMDDAFGYSGYGPTRADAVVNLCLWLMFQVELSAVRAATEPDYRDHLAHLREYLEPTASADADRPDHTEETDPC